MDHLFDDAFGQVARRNMYRALLAPEMYPEEKPMLVHNWPADDREMYCGGEYTPGYELRHVPQRLMLGAV